MTAIVKDWVIELGLRHQGVIVSAARGPDGVLRDDPIKTLVRIYRGQALNAFCGDVREATSYMQPFDPDVFESAARQVLRSLDHYNLHFFLHFTHAVEIMGYRAPVNRDAWLWLYINICRKMHINPETEEQLDARLGADEVSFGRQQHD
jgi:hypothetical protein